MFRFKLNGSSPGGEVLATWGQKPHQIWLAIMVALNVTRPGRIVELGSGKSTRYFAEYAQEFGASFCSIEENARWVASTRSELKASRLDYQVVIHVPLVAHSGGLSWYDPARIRNILARDVDAWLIDGPTGANRRSQLGQLTIKEFFKPAKLLIVDDLQRRDIFDFFEELIGQVPGLDFFVLSYFSGKTNLIGFAVPRQDAQTIRRVLGDLGISVMGSTARKLISED